MSNRSNVRISSYNPTYQMDKDVFWQIWQISFDVKLNMLFTLILLQDPKMFFDSNVDLIQN